MQSKMPKVTMPAPLQLSKPALQINNGSCILEGAWVAAAFNGSKQVNELRRQIKKCTLQTPKWNLTRIRLDHIGAELLWSAWDAKLPTHIELKDEQIELFERLKKYHVTKTELTNTAAKPGVIATIGYRFLSLLDHLYVLIQLLGQFTLDCWFVITRPFRAPWKDFCGQVLRMGAQALPITGLVGLLIGIVIVYLLGGFLKNLSAGELIIPLVGVASIRELGPLIGAILVAGRSGSTITAQIGVMRLREELSAMHVLGIPISRRLVWPRVTALTLTMPFVAMWTSLLMILGGMISANISVDISYNQFLQVLPTSISITTVWINIIKSAVFGFLIAIIGCHFGLKVQSDTESLGNGTTASVVASITAVILADALIAILCRNI